MTRNSSAPMLFCIASNSCRSSLRMCAASFSPSFPNPARSRLRLAASREQPSQNRMLRQEFLNQSLHLWKPRRPRKYFLFLGREMNPGLLLECLRNLRLPGFQVNLTRLNRPIQADADRQAVLMLV